MGAVVIDLLKKAVDHANARSRVIVRVWVLSRVEGVNAMRQTVEMVRGSTDARVYTSIKGLRVVLPNESEIRFAIIRDSDRYRGEVTSLEVVLLGGLLQKVIYPCLFDLRGDCVVEGV